MSATNRTRTDNRRGSSRSARTDTTRQYPVHSAAEELERTPSAMSFVSNSLAGAWIETVRGVVGLARRVSGRKNKRNEEENMSWCESDADSSAKLHRKRRGIASGYDDIIEPPAPVSAPVTEYDTGLDGSGEPGSKDGLALLVLTLAIVLADSAWFHLAGPAGEFTETAVRTLVGIDALVLPVLLGVVSILVMLDATPRREHLTPTIIEASLIVVGLLTIMYIDSGRPAGRQGRHIAGGTIGGYTSSPLVAGFTSWIAMVLLLSIVFYDALILSGTTVRQLIGATEEYFNSSEWPSRRAGEELELDDLYDNTDDMLEHRASQDPDAAYADEDLDQPTQLIGHRPSHSSHTQCSSSRSIVRSAY